ncbi:MAG: 30S ribosomal protein THX [Flavobacteriia bacterium]|nr:30S ribosomal protein THX [Flavobacteriia bacterium]
MGKGDKKSAKGKRVMGSYGNSRKRKSTSSILVKEEKPKKVKTVEAPAEAESKPKKTVKKAESTEKKETKKVSVVKKTTKKSKEE